MGHETVSTYEYRKRQERLDQLWATHEQVAFWTLWWVAKSLTNPEGFGYDLRQSLPSQRVDMLVLGVLGYFIVSGVGVAKKTWQLRRLKSETWGKVDGWLKQAEQEFAVPEMDRPDRDKFVRDYWYRLHQPHGEVGELDEEKRDDNS